MIQIAVLKLYTSNKSSPLLETKRFCSVSSARGLCLEVKVDARFASELTESESSTKLN